MTYLTDEPIDRDRLISSIARPSDGGFVLFEGAVRNHHAGRAVDSIFYDAYRTMAEKEIGRIIDQVAIDVPDAAVAVIHRLGQLVVGDVSIAIACSSPHRAQAFDACRLVIDRIKETVPIWKRERGPGGEEWVGWQQ